MEELKEQFGGTQSFWINFGKRAFCRSAYHFFFDLAAEIVG